MGKAITGETALLMIEIMQKGDPNCEYSIGSRVMKMDSENKDLHSPGAQGVIKGNLALMDETGKKELYLVNFDENGEMPTFITKEKIILL